jgi:DinB superfamily
MLGLAAPMTARPVTGEQDMRSGLSVAREAGRSARGRQLAGRLEDNANALLDFARPLTEAEWKVPVPGDGRPIGVVVDHVASVYPIEIHLAQLIAAGTPIVGVTWATIDEMNAAHAVERADTPKAATLELLAQNSANAASAIRALTDEELARAVPVSLYADAELTCQFMLEDHAVRHSRHHLARLRAALRG